MKKIFILTLFVFINSAVAKDSRVKHYIYSPGKVYKVIANYLIATNIYFPKNEQIANVTLGDSEAWSAEAVTSVNMIVIKPKYVSDSNMTVTTITDNGSKRIYAFDLDVTPRRKNEVYYIEFISTNDKKASSKSYPIKQKDVIDNIKDTKINRNYSYAGSAINIRPVQVWDDGQFTYFQFDKLQPGSTIYEVDNQNKESLINFNVEDNTVIVHKIAARFTIRNGKDIICIFNDNFKTGFFSRLKHKQKTHNFLDKRGQR